MAKLLQINATEINELVDAACLKALFEIVGQRREGRIPLGALEEPLSAWLLLHN